MERTSAPTLLEREGELTQLLGLVDDARAGKGRALLLEGPPGIGKTDLLDAARQLARERGMAVLSARASELDVEFPFGVVRQLFEPLLAAADAKRRARLLQGAAGLARALLEAAPDEADEGADSMARLHALYWLTANLAEEAPLALVVDDVHWADSSSLRFLQFLLPRLEELPVLVALASRPAGSDADRRALDALAADPLARVLRPAPLSDGAVAELVENALDEPAHPAFCAACREATGGNPFLLHELLRELAAEGVTPGEAGVPVVRQLAPPAVSRAVLLRLARLDDDAARLARAVAVLGGTVPLRQACALAELPEERAGEVASALARADVLAHGRPLAFAHPVLRSAVYSDIEEADRSAAHRRAAALLSAEGAAADAVAVHLLATEPTDDPEVVATLRDAAARALSRGAAGTAVACLRRARREPPPPRDRVELTLALASAELQAGEPAAAAAHFEEGLELTDDPRVRAARATQHAAALQALGRHDEAYAVRERAVDEVAPIDEELALLVEVSLIASASLDLSRIGWARERLAGHSDRASAQTPAGARLLATQTCLDAYYGDAPASELADAAERVMASDGLIDPRAGGVSTPFFLAVEALLLADRIEPARQALDAALDRARRRGSALGFASCSGWRCLLLSREGALPEAEADARSCAELSLPQGWFELAPPMLGYVLEALLDRGELDEAQRVLDQSGMADRRDVRDVTLDPLARARARLRVLRGDPAGARADLESISRSDARWNTDRTLEPPVLIAAELLSDDVEAERERVERMLAQARAWGTPRAVGVAVRAAGLVESGSRRLDRLKEAAELLESSPARLEYARAMLDLGAALRRANRRTAARAPLRSALDLAEACGARPLAERAGQELRAAGGRPRRARTSGPDALTASETRIARMAAGGLSNPEIAQALFVTKKTVEAHLSNAYRKLDIGSRTQLGAALGEERG